MTKAALAGLALTAAVVLASARPASAQSDDVAPPSLQVTAEATVTAKPDRAEVDVGVETRAATPDEASARNARQLTAVIAALRKTLGTGAAIETVGYALRPEYEYPEEGGEPRLAGYVARNVVRVSVADLARVDDVLDTAAAAGATRIDQVRFTLADESEPRARAIEEAAKKARAQATALASALGVTIERILTAVESGPHAPPPGPPVPFAASATRVATPVQPGLIEVRASVTLTVAINQAGTAAEKRR